MLREARGLSQQRLADDIGISQQSIYKYENEKAEPDIATMISLAKYFCTTVDYLIGNENRNNLSVCIGSEKYMDISPTECYFLNLYRALSKNAQESIIKILEELPKENKEE